MSKKNTKKKVTFRRSWNLLLVGVRKNFLRVEKKHQVIMQHWNKTAITLLEIYLTLSEPNAKELAQINKKINLSKLEIFWAKWRKMPIMISPFWSQWFDKESPKKPGGLNCHLQMDLPGEIKHIFMILLLLQKSRWPVWVLVTFLLPLVGFIHINCLVLQFSNFGSQGPQFFHCWTVHEKTSWAKHRIVHLETKTLWSWTLM